MIVRAYFVRDVGAGRVFQSEVREALSMSPGELSGGLRNRDNEKDKEYYRCEDHLWYLGKDTPDWWDQEKGFAALDEWLATKAQDKVIAQRTPQARLVREEIESWEGLLPEVAYLKALEHEMKALDADHPAYPGKMFEALQRHKVSLTDRQRFHIVRRLKEMGYIEVLTSPPGWPMYLTEKYLNSTQEEIEGLLRPMPEPEVEADPEPSTPPAQATYELNRVAEINVPVKSLGARAFTYGTDQGNRIRVEVPDPVQWTTEEKLRLAGFVLTIPVPVN
jgi:hypothetical protein